MKTLHRGHTGAEVSELQKLLGIPVDGIFGNETQSAVAVFQKKNGLTADGIVGVQTWVKLGKQQPKTDREKLEAKFGNPMEDPRQFEVNWMMTWFCKKDHPGLPMNKIYANRLLIPHLKEVFAKLDEKGLLLEIMSYGGCWNPRYIRGYEAQKILSIHTYALAVDFNTLDNPLGLTKAQAMSRRLNPFSEQFDQVWRDCGWVCGIDFGRKDGMHYQFTNV